MPAEAVLDASVAAKVFIPEEGAERAEAFVLSGARLIAPDFVLVELANVATKRLRQGVIPRQTAERMVVAATSLFDELLPAGGLIGRAFELAADHGLSTYDATYVALAEQRRCILVTADLRLIAKIEQASLAVAVRSP
jgi:predicted nucleic acid-binding protein